MMTPVAGMARLFVTAIFMTAICTAQIQDGPTTAVRQKRQSKKMADSTQKTQPAASNAKLDEDSVSPGFREQGYRALDAIRRIPEALSEDKVTGSDEQRFLDAEKALDEAKYKIATTRDRELHDILERALLMKEFTSKMDVLNRRWRPYNEIESQCEIEAVYFYEPESLSHDGQVQAQAGNCLERFKKATNHSDQQNTGPDGSSPVQIPISSSQH